MGRFSYGLKKRLKRTKGTEFSLQITSLADILMIVLIFLLKTFSSGLIESETVTASKEIRLPTVLTAGQAKKGIKVEIFKDRVEIEGKVGSRLAYFRFSDDDLNNDLSQNNGSSRSLNRALLKAKLGYKPDAAEVKTGAPISVWIVADKQAPYATIQTVIASAAVNGFTDFKMAVVKED